MRQKEELTGAELKTFSWSLEEKVLFCSKKKIFYEVYEGGALDCDVAIIA